MAEEEKSPEASARAAAVAVTLAEAEARRAAAAAQVSHAGSGSLPSAMPAGAEVLTSDDLARWSASVAAEFDKSKCDVGVLAAKVDQLVASVASLHSTSAHLETTVQQFMDNAGRLDVSRESGDARERHMRKTQLVDESATWKKSSSKKYWFIRGRIARDVIESPADLQSIVGEAVHVTTRVAAQLKSLSDFDVSQFGPRGDGRAGQTDNMLMVADRLELVRLALVAVLSVGLSPDGPGDSTCRERIDALGAAISMAAGQLRTHTLSNLVLHSTPAVRDVMYEMLNYDLRLWVQELTRAALLAGPASGPPPADTVFDMPPLPAFVRTLGFCCSGGEILKMVGGVQAGLGERGDGGSYGARGDGVSKRKANSSSSGQSAHNHEKIRRKFIPDTTTPPHQARRQDNLSRRRDVPPKNSTRYSLPFSAAAAVRRIATITPMGCVASKQENDCDSAGGTLGGVQSSAADEAASVIAGAGLTARVHLSLSCKGLANLDVGSKSDPFVVVSMKTAGASSWSEIGRTEVVANNLDPTFVTLIPAIFRFEEVQMLRFEVFDVAGSFNTSDASKLSVAHQSRQGTAECALASVMGAHGQTTTQALDSPHLPHQRATITIRAEEAENSSDLVVFELGASGCGSRHKSVFFRISRTAEAGASIPCFKSAVSHATASTLRWRESQVGLPILSNGDPFRPLVVELFAYKRSGAHVPLGSCKFSVDTMLAKAGSGSTFSLSGGTGEVVVHRCNLVPQPSFFDFLAGGMEMQFAVAIDYTASNGDPNLPDSLHFHDPAGRSLNEYSAAISSVGSILEHYDSDCNFPVLGFGGRPHPGGAAVHCFSVNRNEANPEVHGISTILDVYRESLTWVQLSGPTLFAPVINQAAAVAASQRTLNPENQTYHVLMIVTDGVINDMGNTMNALVAAADLPFSVIIVGVGNADFSLMEELDGDDVRIANNDGKKASRDIVQFVPMREFKTKGFHALAREVLAEIPQQVVEYMADNRIIPCKPKPRLPPPPPPPPQYQAKDLGPGSSSHMPYGQ